MELDNVIHERSRLRIITYLAGRENGRVSFNELQESLGFTSGNLSVQLKKLNEAAYISIDKSFRENKPYTTIKLTAAGRKAMNRYIQEMENIIQTIKNQQ